MPDAQETQVSTKHSKEGYWHLKGNVSERSCENDILRRQYSEELFYSRK